MTTATPPVLAKYREAHRVEPIRDFDEDFGMFVFRCSHDHLRIHQERDGGWRHDASEIASLAALERGEPIKW